VRGSHIAADGAADYPLANPAAQVVAQSGT